MQHVLLPLIKSSLETLSQLGSTKHAYITPSPNYMPSGTRPPCIGISPGRVVRKEMTGGGHELRMAVILSGYVALTGDAEICLTGDKGVYVLLDAAIDKMIEDGLDITGFEGLQIGPDKPSEMYKTGSKSWWVKVAREIYVTVERF